jgi:hypothetical protein
LLSDFIALLSMENFSRPLPRPRFVVVPLRPA